ncbi:hypothetical protein [Marinobacter lutaoensis]|nr:hypothetical protein [Marinobacter lutaoensis]
MHTADYLVFDRSEYDAFVTSLGSQSASAIHEAIMADRDALECLARLRLKTTIREGRWAFDVTCHTQTPGFSHDPRDSGGYCTSIFHMEQDSEHSNLARTVDLTNSGDLEGTGLNSWLVDQARWRFERIAGPDPWICGSLSHVDADNERRVPFWRRHVDGAV